MKRLLLCGGILISALCASSQTLFTYGKESVSKKEFEQAFLKNQTEQPTDKNIQEYLDLYIPFKLKVYEAKSRRYDTLSALRADLQSFREQIENYYLKDEKMVNALIKEAFERSRKDILLTTFFIPKNDGIDSIAVRIAATELRRTNLKNLTSENLKIAGLPAVKKEVGFVTVFTLPYEYESILYSLPVGKISDPIPVSDGWYMFLNSGERPAVGKIRVAQILISAPANMVAERARAGKTADSLYHLLLEGADFAQLARDYSHDRSSFFNEGILPAFGVGKYTKAFEEKAFSLKEPGDMLPPFETDFGFHILKLISKEPVAASMDNTTYLESLGSLVAADNRMKEANEAFRNQMTHLTGAKRAEIKEGDLWKITDSALFANRIIAVDGISEQTPLILFNNGTVSTVGNWIMYLKNKGISYSDYPAHMYPALFTEFVNDAVQNQYRLRLDEFNPEFRRQLQEFEDGNMLFEIMEREVWEPSAQDSSGLQTFYESNKSRYVWEKSADATVYTSINETIASRVREAVQAGKTMGQLLLEFDSLLRIDSGRVEVQDLPDGGSNLSVNKISQPAINEEEETVSFYIIHKLYPEKQIKTFEEARGAVLIDYQAALEEALISSLRKKYPVKVNQKIRKALFK